MTFPDTRPYCGQCGWKPDNSGLGDIGDDLVCDSCGADLSLYGFTNEPPPPVGAFLTWDNVSGLTSPNDGNVDVNDVFEFEMTLSEIDATTSRTIVDQMSNSNSYSAKVRVNQLDVFSLFWTDQGGSYIESFDPVPDVVGKHIYLVTYDNVDAVLSVDGVPFSTINKLVQAPIVPYFNQTNDIRIGISGTSGLPANYFSVQMKVGGTVRYRMDAADAGFSAGPVAAGSTFDSNGRTWTIIGDGVSYTPAL